MKKIILSRHKVKAKSMPYPTKLIQNDLIFHFSRTKKFFLFCRQM